jgi:DNA transposition AAA+ family ATPase
MAEEVTSQPHRAPAEVIQIDRAAALAAVVPEAPAHVVTPTARQISTLLLTAQAYSMMVLLEGISGIGKSASVRRYAESHKAVHLAEMAPHSRGVWALLDVLADSLRVGSHQGQAPHRVAGEIIAHLKQRPGTLLIIDEAQHLEDAALEEVRCIHDQTGCGLALVGSIQLFGRLAGGGRTDKMAQIRSRVSQRLSLKSVLAGDVEKILDAWQVKGSAERKFLAEIAKKPGALRAMTKTLSLALAAAAGDGRKAASLQDLRESWEMIGAIG